MGSCLSKKTRCSSAATQSAPDAVKSVVEEEEIKKEVEEPSLLKEEIFIIKHRKSHDNKPLQQQQQPHPQNVPKPQPQVDVLFASTTNSTPTTTAAPPEMVNNVAVTTSSCTKEELDAILIQCGRLSRSNSTRQTTGSSARKYSGSKRSYDFDHNDQDQEVEIATAARYDAQKKLTDDEDDADDNQRRHHRPTHRQHRDRSQGRMRTPSRERDQNQRSASRERGSGGSSSGSGRRVSRSPARRSETTPSTNASNRPAKLVSVPASVTVDKSNNIGVDNQPNNTIKKISAKRSVAEAAGRSAASPRSQSPAKTSNANSQQQQPSLSRSSSRKTDQSPCRRNPLADIDPNKPTTVNRQQIKSKENEDQVIVKESVNLVINQAPTSKPHSETNSGQGINGKGCRIGSLDNKKAKEQQQLVEDAKRQPLVAAESLKPPQMVTRSRSAGRSQDLDINPETLSYTTLLLEDIQNFHQKSTPTVSLPPGLTKACSIHEAAVADLNSSTRSNLSSAFLEDRRSPHTTATNLVGKKPSEAKDPFVESEILVSNDLLETNFHQYVTVRRGGTLCGEDMDDEESSGSNSFVAGSQQQHWGVSSNSSWEPNSADSTDRWTSRSNRAEEDKRIPQVFQRVATLPESSPGMEEARRGFTGQRTGIGPARLGTFQKIPVVARTATT